MITPNNTPSSCLLELAEKALYLDSISEKLRTSLAASAQLEQQQNLVKLAINTDSRKPISEVLFPSNPRWVSAKELPRRGMGTEQGRVALLHAIAHIEFIAIHLAWDIVYRFKGLPADFYRDWVEVAIDEARHFQLIETRLNQFGCSYGELPVHGGLWEMAVDTQDDVIARLALVPRYLEARGLDVTPGMISSFTQYGDNHTVELLQLILNEEIDHVRKGDKWFRYFCTQNEIEAEPHYQKMLSTHLKGRPRGGLNHKLRLEAGFSKTELAQLQKITKQSP